MAASFDTENREDTNLYIILIARLFEHIYLLFEHIAISLFVLKEYNSTKEFFDENLQKESKVSIWAPLKKARLKTVKNRNTKVHYVTHSKLHQLKWHWDFRTIAVLNTVPGSKINRKEIVRNYECSSLNRSFSCVSNLQNHGGDRKSFGSYMQSGIP